ncbi:MAG TPA: riboflavin kinase [Candidatus Saccharimonadales bacterium]|nr:riboflavin kinase [Candidatus Saccharimonadales bacterium]
MADLPVTLTGKVARFKGNGRQLGYPTANLAVQTAARDGVYFGFADLGDFRHHPSLIFVGVPTTVGDTTRRVEIHLLDIPDQDYYGLQLSVTLEHYQRPNQTFADLAQLIAAMQADGTAARQWFAKRTGSGNTKK